jgi:hypothetical protein
MDRNAEQPKNPRLRQRRRQPVDKGDYGLLDLQGLNPGKLVKGYSERTDKRSDTENHPSRVQGSLGLGYFLNEVHVLEKRRKLSAIEGGII